MVSNPINSITFFGNVQLCMVFSRAGIDFLLCKCSILCLWWRHHDDVRHHAPMTPFAQTSHQAKLISASSIALDSLPWWKIAFLVQYCNFQLTPNITGSEVFTPCNSVKPIKAWNAVNNVLFANFVFHHLLPNHSMRNVVILCKFYEGNSTFNEDLNKLFNRSSNLRHSSDCLDQDRMDDTLS